MDLTSICLYTDSWSGVLEWIGVVILCGCSVKWGGILEWMGNSIAYVFEKLINMWIDFKKAYDQLILMIVTM